MGWFWKKQEATPATVGDQLIAAAVANSHRTDKEWRRLEQRQQQEQKRVEKEMARAVKQAAKEMKKQEKQAKKERAKAQKQIKKELSTMRDMQKKIVKEEKKLRRQERKELKNQTKKHAKAIRVQAKATKKALQDKMKRRKRLLRQKKKEEKRRLKQKKQAEAQLREEDEQQRQRVETERETQQLRVALEEMGANGPRQPPKFKESQTCTSCSTKFKRLPSYRRHHCRNCGESFCSSCLSSQKRSIPWFKLDKPQKVCLPCDVNVFNAMGGNNDEPVAAAEASATSPSQPSQPQTTTPLQRSESCRSEQPEDDSPPPSRRFLGLRPRSRRENNSSKSKKNSLWTLPIRPLLKRKESAEQERNRAWDLDLMLEKEETLARQRKAHMVVVSEPRRLAPAV